MIEFGEGFKAGKAQLCTGTFITNIAIEGQCEENDDNFKAYEKQVTF